MPERRLDPRPSTLSRDAFVARFGGVYEHSPWIAETAWDAGIGPEADTPEGLAAALRRALSAAPGESKLALIRAHPDLAGRAAVAGELTRSSRDEQAGAGLDRCTPEEFRRFQDLNEAYKAKFGFPFILAVAGRTRQEILAAFEARLGNPPEAEFAEALRQVDRIAALRLAAMAEAR
ncbi:2-oxo-4-hydroxy-4-carboxy-5-ureidoimidazoline decarboxylase [Faunimonas sp. B44]|uniref:2-oxo-4-hydroxy-4-carboxy-5-ureidoimidazoline decarboxylase n=1 Tax=Faunimonas sp. B44 TaxID=3461493 RepID=UPI0040443A84